MPPSDAAPTPDANSPDAQWINTPAALDTWLQQIADGGVLGVDTEFTRYKTFYAHLSLLQLAHAGRHTLVDPLAFDIGDVLQRHLGERPITTVMHSAGEDLEVLAPWLPEGPAVLFDTQLAAAFAGLDLGLGYRALVERFCGVTLDKGETRSDWMQRPLSPSQCRYATLDVVYLQALHETLSEMVARQGHNDWLQADCERLKQRARQADAVPEQPQKSLVAAAAWPHDDQARLRRLLQWRERRARELDKPRNWLLDNERALALAPEPAMDAERLRQVTKGLRALRGDEHRHLLATLQAPLTADECAATESIPPSAGPDMRRTIRDMKQTVNALAVEHQLPAGLLCPRKALEAILQTGPWPPSVQGWRADLLRDPLNAWLPE